jgi:predicted aspartyl protease
VPANSRRIVACVTAPTEACLPSHGRSRRTVLRCLYAAALTTTVYPTLALPNIEPALPGQTDDLAQTGAVTEPQFAAPTRLDRIGRVMAPVMVNGQGPFRFVIDTGASRSTVSPQLAERLALVPVPGEIVRLNGVTGSADVPTVRVTNLQVGGLELGQQNLPVLWSSIMANADGILGVAGIQDRHIDVDFRRDRVTVSAVNSRVRRGRMLTVQAQRMYGGMLAIEALIKRVNAVAIIDTGSERTLGNLALLERLRIAKSISATTVTTSVYGATPEIDSGDVKLLPPITLGPLRIVDVQATFGDFHIFAVWGLRTTPALLIGMDMLGTLDRLVVDYGRNEVSMLSPGIAADNIGIRTSTNPTRLPRRP